MVNYDFVGHRLAKVAHGRLKTRAADERQRLVEALKEAGGRKTEAARLLGISRVTLWKRLKINNLEVGKVIRG
ncbi:MAG: helix-turn-helix domain-containing protein [Desulfobaccales bacterium]|nr:helix-turn-helix domain-containing protein [Desulfobaccales bacterium]